MSLKLKLAGILSVALPITRFTEPTPLSAPRLPFPAGTPKITILIALSHRESLTGTGSRQPPAAVGTMPVGTVTMP